MRQSITEVGYLGMLKAKHGWKLHQGRFRGVKGREEREQMAREGKVWSIEEGVWVSEEETNKLEKELEEIRSENERRREST